MRSLLCSFFLGLSPRDLVLQFRHKVCVLLDRDFVTYAAHVPHIFITVLRFLMYELLPIFLVFIGLILCCVPTLMLFCKQEDLI